MRFTLLLLFFTLNVTFAQAAVAAPPAAVAPTQTLSAAELTRDAVEAKLGRKLKFKERIALSVVRGKVKRAERRQAKPRGGSTDGLAIASFVLGVLGLFLLFPAIPALILGIISLGRYERQEYYTGKGLAIAGVIMGGLVIFAVLLVVGLFALIFG